MKNDYNASEESNKENLNILTTNEITNVIGENYKTTVKRLAIMSAEGRIKVTEKLVNGRKLKAYSLSIEDLKELKNTFVKMHLSKNTPADIVQMQENAQTIKEIEHSKANVEENINVKFYEVVEKNATLEKELKRTQEELQKTNKELQKTNNDNVQLNADLTVARSELKFIEDKQKTFEGEVSKLTQEKQQLEKTLALKNKIIFGFSLFVTSMISVLAVILLLK